jgi:hypothetical protein
MNGTHRELDGHYPLTHFLLYRIIGTRDATISTARRASKQVTRTVHNDPNILHKTIHKFQRLCRRRLRLLSRQPVQSLQHRFHVILSEELLSKFL